MHAWLRRLADALAAETATPPAALALSAKDIDALLDFAGSAAHDSGARLNAPLACYLLGVVHGRTGATVEELVAFRQKRLEPKA
jgi:hypothetical protein